MIKKHYDWNKIQEFYDQGNSLIACEKHFGVAKESMRQARIRGDFKTRPPLRVSVKQVLVSNSKHCTSTARNLVLRHNLIPYICACGQDENWFGKKIALHLDHINGISNDHRLENLRFLCPNCHSQTPTWGGAHVKNW